MFGFLFRALLVDFLDSKERVLTRGTSTSRGSIVKKILITGAAGFIGSHLAEELIRQGNKVVGIDNLSTGREENISSFQGSPSFAFVKGDVRDLAVLEKLVAECDVVYHLAAAVGVKLVMENPVSSIETNVYGSANAFSLAGKYKKKIFLASSSEVYGKEDSLSLREDGDLRFGPSHIVRWSYGCTKLMSEYTGLSYYKDRGLEVVIGRFFNVCGPRQSGAYGMVVPRFVRASLSGDPITIYGDGSSVRSFTYISDAVAAIIGLMNSENTAGNVFNIGNPNSVSIKELAQLVKEISKTKSPIINVPYEEVYGEGFEDMHYRVPDINKTKAAIGFVPKVQLKEMIEDILEYWKERL